MTSPHPIAAIAGILLVVLSLSAMLIWVERRLLALWQDRYGPNRVGPFGLLQVVADMIKIFTKEDWIPPFADKVVFVIAPMIVMVTVLLSFAVVPFAPGIIVADLNVALLFFLGMSSLGVYSIVLAGWASDSKYSLLGGLRAAAQMISYEVFMSLSVMGVVLLAGSFSLTAIVEAQKRLWFVVPQFLGFALVSHRGCGRGTAVAFRPSGGRSRVGRRFPFRVLRDEVRNVLCGRIPRPHPDLIDDYGAVFRRLAGSVVASDRVVLDQDVCVHLFLYSAAGVASKAAFRSAHVLGVEDDASTGARQSVGNRRHRGGVEVRSLEVKRQL